MESLILSELMYDSDSDDTSDCSSSDDELFVFNYNEKRARIENYVDDVVSQYNDGDFQSHFRLTRTAVEDLLQEMSCNATTNVKKPANLKKHLLLTLWTLANQESFRGVGDRFGMLKGEAYNVFLKTCKHIYTLRNNYIYWPQNEENALKMVEDFNSLRGNNSFPHVIGCVDGCHIQIPGPRGDNSYYNRKGYHSILLQGICDSKMRFIDVFCGWPGSSHDARMWKNSPIYGKLNNNDIVLPNNCHLLGDTAYPLRTFLITPFRDNGHLTRQQKKFNTRLSSVRVIIEQCFGRLKGSFRRLKYLSIYNLTHAKFIITTACILHNICVNAGIDTANQEVEVEDGLDEQLLIENRNEDQDAVLKRNQLMASFQ